eukprot:532531_1
MSTSCIFVNKQDQFLFSSINSTLISILQEYIPVPILKEIAEYATGSVHQCNACRQSTHILFSDKRLTEKAWIRAKIVNETLTIHNSSSIKNWIQSNNFYFYLETYIDQNNQSKLLFFCNNCISNLINICTRCYKFDDISAGHECRRFHRVNNIHYSCCGCRKLVDSQTMSSYIYGEHHWCMNCNGFVCTHCAIECYCDIGGYCSFRRSWRCFEFLDLFLHIFYSTQNTSQYFRDNRHIENVEFGNDIKYLHNIWNRLCDTYIKQILKFDNQVVAKQFERLSHQIQTMKYNYIQEQQLICDKTDDAFIMGQLSKLIEEIKEIDEILEDKHRLHNVHFENIECIEIEHKRQGFRCMSGDYTQNGLLIDLAINYSLRMDEHRKGFLFNDLRFKQRRYKNNDKNCRRRVRSSKKNKKLKSYRKRKKDRKMNHISNKKFIKRYMMSLQY